MVAPRPRTSHPSGSDADGSLLRLHGDGNFSAGRYQPALAGLRRSQPALAGLRRSHPALDRLSLTSGIRPSLPVSAGIRGSVPVSAGPSRSQAAAAGTHDRLRYQRNVKAMSICAIKNRLNRRLFFIDRDIESLNRSNLSNT